jgi:hypothetical protein
LIENEIINQVEETKKKLILRYADERSRSWNKCLGDICSEVFIHYIKKQLSSLYKVSKPASYILGFPTEFDLLIR